MDNSNKSDNQRQFDGRPNYQFDDEIEILLESHFEKYNISRREICRNFPIYAPAVSFLRDFWHIMSCFA